MTGIVHIVYQIWKPMHASDWYVLQNRLNAYSSLWSLQGLNNRDKTVHTAYQSFVL
jgi:hypothetical protein